MGGMIKGINKIGEILDKPEYQARINEVLSDLGFHEVCYNKNYNQNKNFYKKLTISIFPMLNEDTYQSEKITDVVGLRGYNGYRNYLRKFYVNNTEKDIYYVNGGSSSKWVIARYYKERNLLLFLYPIFSNLNFNIPLVENVAFEKLFTMIINACKDGKIEEGKIDVEAVLIENFMKEYANKQERIIENIKMETEQINEYETIILNNYRTIASQMSQEISIKEFISNGKEELNKRIAEIKAHPFVKSIEINCGDIIINVGEITIDIEGKPIKIGEMFFSISPTQINIDCVERKKIWTGSEWKELIHPHISGSNTSSICFGERGTIIHELLGKMELGKLVYMLYLWAKSYNPSDKYNAIGYWTGELGLHPDEIARREAWLFQ